MGSLSIHLEDTEAKTAMPTTAYKYVLEPVHLPDFLSIRLLFGRAEVQGSPCASLCEQALVIVAETVDPFLM